MPKQGRRLSSEEVGLLRAWIDQGLPWDADVSLRTLTLQGVGRERLNCRQPLRG